MKLTFLLLVRELWVIFLETASLPAARANHQPTISREKALRNMTQKVVEGPVEGHVLGS